ncbi:unnamed protein product [Periconia digitata]|uniref:Uncharacterized protein n=1 Tax=Periconia digitata TaxID=1303443 RepID=A0A9W4XTA8_9PLEO|nr:unnamed protein product [Periconia digitata]
MSITLQPLSQPYTFDSPAPSPTLIVTPAPEPSSRPTNVPMLTTIYRYPTNCKSQWYLGSVPYEYNTFVFSWGDSRFGPYAVDPSYTLCLPFSARPIYSPGICPEDHTVADITQHYMANSINKTTTWWKGICCRSEMMFHPLLTSWYDTRKTVADPLCVSQLATPINAYSPITFYGDSTTVFIDYTSLVFGNMTSGASVVETNSTTGLKTLIQSGWAIAGGLQVAWEMSDFSLFPTDYASSLAEQMNISLNLSITSKDPGPITATSPQPPPSKIDKGSIGKGSIIGIIVGAIAGAILLGTSILFVLRRRHNKLKTRKDANREGGDQDQGVGIRPWYLGGLWKSEADASAERKELEAQHGSGEMDTAYEIKEIDSRTVYVVPGPPAELPASDKATFI